MSATETTERLVLESMALQHLRHWQRLEVALGRLDLRGRSPREDWPEVTRLLTAWSYRAGTARYPELVGTPAERCAACLDAVGKWGVKVLLHWQDARADPDQRQTDMEIALLQQYEAYRQDCELGRQLKPDDPSPQGWTLYLLREGAARLTHRDLGDVCLRHELCWFLVQLIQAQTDMRRR